MSEKSRHTPGRLRVSTGSIYRAAPVDTEGYPMIRVALMDREEPHTAPVERDANAHRLADCWNALEGFADPAAAPALLEAAEALVAGINAQFPVEEESAFDPWPEWHALRAAIRQARGE